MLSTAHKGLLATLTLVCVQVSLGLLFKLSQDHGRYQFSQASSLTLTECIKLILSVLLYRKEVNARRPSAVALAQSGDGSSAAQEKRSPLVGDRLYGEKNQVEEAAPYGSGATSADGLPIPYDTSRQALYECWRREINPGIVRGFFGLALLYVINNNTVFFVYLLADPGTIQLVKASTTIISALIMRLFLARSIRELQWHALLLQTGGLMVTQMGNASLDYAPSTYALLLGMTCISAIAGVANDHLAKSYTASLHAENMVMYIAGIALNLSIYCFKKATNWNTEPAFLSGYGSAGAILLLLLNASIGIVITTVYKYADAIYKGLATSATTAIMLILSTLFFGVQMNNTALTGCAVVFLASYTYIKAGMKPPSGPITLADGTQVPRPKPQRQLTLGVLFVACVAISLIYTLFKYGISLPPPRQEKTTSSTGFESAPAFLEHFLTASTSLHYVTPTQAAHT